MLRRERPASRLGLCSATMLVMDASPSRGVNHVYALMRLAASVALIGGFALLAVMMYLLLFDNLQELEQLAMGAGASRSAALGALERALLASVFVVAVEFGVGLVVLTIALLRVRPLMSKVVHAVWNRVGTPALGLNYVSLPRLHRARLAFDTRGHGTAIRWGLAIIFAALVGLVAMTPLPERGWLPGLSLGTALAILVVHVPRVLRLRATHRHRVAHVRFRRETTEALAHSMVGSILLLGLWFAVISWSPQLASGLVRVLADVVAWRLSGLESRMAPSVQLLIEHGHLHNDVVGLKALANQIRSLEASLYDKYLPSVVGPALESLRCWFALYAPSLFVLSGFVPVVHYWSHDLEEPVV